MTWQINDYTAGNPRVGADGYSLTQAGLAMGTKVRGSDPYWGAGEFIYLKSGGAAIPNGALVVWDSAYVATAVANTANLGRPVAVVVGAAPAAAAVPGMPANTYGWFQIGGLAPVSSTASVAANAALGITGAGTVGAFTAGKQIVGAVSALPASTAVVKNVMTTNLSPVITVLGGMDGWFPGITISGTGMSGTILSISGKDVTLSANSTATAASVAATGTYTGFNIATLNFPLAQGQIT